MIAGGNVGPSGIDWVGGPTFCGSVVWCYGTVGSQDFMTPSPHIICIGFHSVSCALRCVFLSSGVEAVDSTVLY
nr:hypothetical protein Iba_chr14cCG8490 [Ipomoea batatas]